MCGISGMARVHGTVDPSSIERMASTMCHRGPDGAGTWTSADGRVGFGHRRLAIIDLSEGGHQPMLDGTGRLSITFNGEIYNFPELRAELESKGHTFRSSSDTEVILAAYREWKEDCVEKLNGMFAFAIHDLDDESLLFARDRAGEKPLYYWHEGSRLVFTSELKALKEIPDFRPVIDPYALNQYLAFGYIPGESCIFRGVKKLEQGHAMRFDLRTGALSRWAYWSLPEPVGERHPSDHELVLELERLLEDSVRMRMISDVPVGVMLSGGVDSSLVTAMAARHSSKPVRTFNISFPGHGAFNEAPHARLVARHFGTEHVELAAEPATVDLLPLLARQYDEPMADSSMVPMYLVSKLIRREATVALGGDGGDELFGGYLHYEWVRRQALIRRFVPNAVRSLVSTSARALPLGVRGRNYLVGTAGDIDWAMAHANLYFDVRSRRRLLAPLGIDADESPEENKTKLACGKSAVQRAMAMDFRSYLVDDILVKVDRASMLTSLEVRAPLLDPRIIDFAFGKVPDRLRAGRGTRKVLLKNLAARVLPKELDVTRKQGFSIPLHTWFRGDWGRYMRDVLREGELFDPSVIESLIAGQERGLANTQRLYSLTMFELWRREFGASF